MNPCGSSADLPDGAKKAFDIFNSVDPMVLPKGFNIPKGLPKGGSKPGDKGDPDPKSPEKTDPAPPPKTAPPETAPPKTDPSTTNDPPKTNDPSKTTDKPQSSSNKACTRGKRAGGKNSKIPYQVLRRSICAF